jgi:hypothetical protein
MGKYEEPFEETQDLYNQLIQKADLSNFINITILTNNKAKDIFKVNKANELLKYRTGDDIIIVINEKIFDQLSPEQRMIVAEESLASIHFDAEKDKLVITKPDVVTFSGVLRKYTFTTWNTLKESIDSLYQSNKRDEDEASSSTTPKKNKF